MMKRKPRTTEDSRSQTFRHLILFDIDGTLVLGKRGAHLGAMNAAGRDLFGPDFSFDAIDRFGQLDSVILDLAMRHHHLETDASRHAKFQERYVEYLTEAARETRVLEGVPVLLDALEKTPGIELGLLTGNWREAARVKLEVTGIGFDRFAVGAFGEDASRRGDLVPVALERAHHLGGTLFDSSEVIIIGDTPRDIDCARQNGCRSLAVASGYFTRETLAESEPTALVDSLLDDAPLWEMLHAGAG
jgi:phosphoglycolate phosphatase-like HAD superfamily hydrolase